MNEGPGLREPACIGAFCARQAMRVPHAPAVVFGELRWTYAELHERVEACARALIACGIAKGDRVAMLSNPRPEFLVVFLATARIGAIWLGMNPVQQLEEYRQVLGDSRPSILFAFTRTRERDNRPILDALAAELPFVRHRVLWDRDSGNDREYADFIATGAALPESVLTARAAMVEPGDTALIVYTSGSTGRPKGAMLSQGNLAHCARMYCGLWPLDPLRLICNLPVTHVACCVETAGFALAAGGTVVFQEQFDAQAFLETIARERVSWIALVPTMLHRILALPDWTRHDTTSLRVILFGGAAMPADMIVELKRLVATVVGCWGMTETTSGVTFTDPGDSIDILSRSAGKPAPSVEVAVLGEDGAPLPAGQTGELAIRGPCVFAGYFGMPEATREAIDTQGWLHSGDLAQLDGEGRITIVGRIKEMFKSGGYNVYPREVENALEAHPAIAMAVIVPVPDPVYQEVGTAFILREQDRLLTVEGVLQHCRGRLANYKIPKHVFIRDALPMLANGKIDRAALGREAAAAS